MKLLAWFVVAILAVASVNAYYCYQETANVSTACGGLSTGNYNFSTVNWSVGHPVNLSIDGDFDTYAEPALNASLVHAFFRSNYSIPSVANKNNITIKYRVGLTSPPGYRDASFSLINSSCANYNSNLLLEVDVFGIDLSYHGFNINCFNGSWVNIVSWNPGTTDLSTRFYEEAVNFSMGFGLNFNGDITNASYYPVCTLNGTSVNTSVGGLNYFDAGTYVLSCAAGSSYLAYNNSLVVLSLPVNYSFNLSEFVFNASFYDEETNAPIAQAFNVLAIGPAGLAFNQSVSGVFNISNLTAGDWEFRYWASENYTTVRSYFLTLASSSNPVVRLYAINDSVSSYFVASVIDQYGAICANCTVSLLRGQFEGGAYVSYVVEMAKTDGTGAAVLRLHPNNVYYKFFITSNSQGSLTTTYSKITSSSQTFQVSKSVPGGLFTLLTQPAQNVSFNAATNTFSLNWLDTTNTITGGCLVVKKTSQFGVVSVVANSCAVGSTGSVIYTVVDVNGTSYQANGNISTASDSYVLSSQVDYRTTYAVFGLAGVFFATILFVFAIFLAAPSAPAVVIVGIVGVMVVALIGLIASSWMALAGVAVIGIITVFLMNRGN